MSERDSLYGDLAISSRTLISTKPLLFYSSFLRQTYTYGLTPVFAEIIVGEIREYETPRDPQTSGVKIGVPANPQAGSLTFDSTHNQFKHNHNNNKDNAKIHIITTSINIITIMTVDDNTDDNNNGSADAYHPCDPQDIWFGPQGLNYRPFGNNPINTC